MPRRRLPAGVKLEHLVGVKLNDAQFAGLERLRGSLPAQDWIRSLIDEAIARADAEAVPTASDARVPTGGGAVPTGPVG